MNHGLEETKVPPEPTTCRPEFWRTHRYKKTPNFWLAPQAAEIPDSDPGTK
jgi:hypothetical protein